MAGFAAGGHGSGMQKQLVGRLYVRLIHCLATMVPKIDHIFRSTCCVYCIFKHDQLIANTIVPSALWWFWFFVPFGEYLFCLWQAHESYVANRHRLWVHLVQRLQVLLFLLFPGENNTTNCKQSTKFKPSFSRRGSDLSQNLALCQVITQVMSHSEWGTFQLGWILSLDFGPSGFSSCRFRGFVSVLVAQVIEIEHAEAVLSFLVGQAGMATTKKTTPIVLICVVLFGCFRK